MKLAIRTLCIISVLAFGALGCGSDDEPTPTPTPTPTLKNECTQTSFDALTDIDNNSYEQVTIGTQVWMRQNLNVTHDPQGNDIDSLCFLDDPNHCETYGRLYTWAVAMNGSTTEGAQGICPDGWHIPTDDEFRTLMDYLGGAPEAGVKLKEFGTDHWIEPNTGNNASCFSALPGGEEDEGVHVLLKQAAIFWSSTESELSGVGQCKILMYDKNNLRTDHFTETPHFSARCIKDNP